MSAHIKAIFMKRLVTAMRDKFNLALQVLVPMIFVFFACIAAKYGVVMSNDSIDLDLGQYNSPLPVPFICTEGAAVGSLDGINALCPMSGLDGSTVSGTQLSLQDLSAQVETLNRELGTFSCANNVSVHLECHILLILRWWGCRVETQVAIH